MNARGQVRETVSRRDWNIILDNVDGNVQLELTGHLNGWLGGADCEEIEYTPDSLGRLDSESSPCPGDVANLQ